MAIFRIQTSATKRMPPDTSWLSNDPPDASDASFVSVAHTGWFNQFLVAKNCLQCATLLRVLNCWKFCWWRGRNTMELKNNKLRLQWLHIMHELKSLNWHHLKGKKQFMPLAVTRPYPTSPLSRRLLKYQAPPWALERIRTAQGRISQ